MKFDRDVQVNRCGTPAMDMDDKDMPSPPPQKTSRSLALLPCTSVFDKDPEKTRRELDEAESKSYRKKDFGAKDYLA